MQDYEKFNQLKSWLDSGTEGAVEGLTALMKQSAYPSIRSLARSALDSKGLYRGRT